MEWPWPTPRMVEAPKPKFPPIPPEWLADTSEHDRLRVAGYPVTYWADPHAGYAVRASRNYEKPRFIVIHYTGEKPVLNFVRYGQSVDKDRGGSYGYTWYLGKDGLAVQGAPLTKRTNHIKPPSHRMRTGLWPEASNKNSLGIALVGGCVVDKTKPQPITLRCSADAATAEQQSAALAIISALRQRFGIPCGNVFGHGEVQKDRESFEGITIARLARSRCTSAMPTHHAALAERNASPSSR